MPYITESEKKEIDEFITYDRLLLTNSGILCYVIYKIIITYLKLNGKSFRTFSEINGAIECAKLEFYRRYIAKYENSKIESNGDVN